MKRVLFSILISVFVVSVFAQPNMDHIQMDNQIYADGIKSVSLTTGY